MNNDIEASVSLFLLQLSRYLINPIGIMLHSLVVGVYYET